ncbi:MAG: S8 family serine peptidase, partial [Lentimicrobiaceae bacterium]|nr:S8 family serine peptidase [Lentimicrobiaceae bacterium]
MRKIFIIIATLSGIFAGQAQENRLFYYHNNEKIYLEKVENRKVIHFGKAVESWQKDDILSQLRVYNYTVAEITPFMYSLSGDLIQFEDNFVISTAKQDGKILYISDMLMYKDSTIQWASNEITVKIYPASDLQDLLQKTNIPVVSFRQLGSCAQMYAVELDVAENSAIEYANILSETGNVEWAEPPFYRFIQKHSVYYASQWGLKNTGQYGGTPGIDIKAEQAWSIATGLGVKVAVLDDGVDLLHPALIDNLLTGYDATNAVYGGSKGGYGGNGSIADAHGTACSGIIAAKDSIKGVAYNANIIPIRIGYSIGGNKGEPGDPREEWLAYDHWIVDGINQAWDSLGADILSNSWGVSAPSYAINSAINAALTQGRNSKGSLVVFSAGNKGINVISHPADSNPDILVVGAISPCGEGKYPESCDGEAWGTSSGSKLDVMAPGVLIPTTDIVGGTGYNPQRHIHTYNGGNIINLDFANQNYTVCFSGTSAAAPHVAGVAALILSVSPNLRGDEVRDIIESTAQKINLYINGHYLYNYGIDPDRPNGTWCEDMGYGLVDAHAAVLVALETICYSGLPFVHGSITQNTTWNSPVHATGDIIITNGATLTITNTVKFEPEVNMIIHPGAKLILNGGTLTNACPEELWQGITNAGTVQLMSGGTIKNAECGIKVQSGGLVSAINAHFVNNTIGVLFQTNAQGGSFTFTNFDLNNNYLRNKTSFEAHLK